MNSPILGELWRTLSEGISWAAKPSITTPVRSRYWRGGRPFGGDPGYTELHPDRIRKGLIAVVSVKLDDPEFLGAAHSVLGGHNVRACVAQAVQKHLRRWLDKHPAQAAAIIDHIIRGACRN
nr:hypothetical protein [Streptacidiphilus sp. P02-A3a]